MDRTQREVSVPVLPAEVRTMRRLVSRAIVLFLVAVVVLLITGAFAGAALEFWFGPPPADWGKDIVQTVRFVY